MSVTQKELKQHFLDLGAKGALYVWGANAVIITKAVMDSLHKTYSTSTYNKKYYEDKLAAGAGKIGADCSGAIYPVSGYDTTAAGYYNRCIQRGNLASIPEDKVCLVFKKNSKGTINHVGCYTGDGYVSEMASSKLNYQRKPLKGNGWDFWGMPDFVSDPNTESTTILKVDGEWGRDTTTKSQMVLGTTVDGIVSNQLVSCQKYVPNALESSWEVSNSREGSELIRGIQELVGLEGREVDGQCGFDTVKAIQEFLKELGLYTGAIDGIMGEFTVSAWQQYINSRL